MSSAPDAHGHAALHDAHDAHEAFTGEPVDTLPADEPRTPGWLPLLGIALFTAAAVLFLATRPASPDAAAKPAEPPPPAPALAAPAPPPRPAEAIRQAPPQPFPQPQRPPPAAPPAGAKPPIVRPGPAPAPHR